MALALLMGATTKAAASEPSAGNASRAVNAAVADTATIPVGGLPTSVATDPLTCTI
jgi:hypothetical protein